MKTLISASRSELSAPAASGKQNLSVVKITVIEASDELENILKKFREQARKEKRLEDPEVKAELTRLEGILTLLEKTLKDPLWK